jgi:hypothetical protein
MTNNDENLSLQAIEMCRRINQKAAAQFHQRGITSEDVAIAALYSAYDLAHVLNGADPVAALAWLRSGIEVLERQILAQPETVQ